MSPRSFAAAIFVVALVAPSLVAAQDDGTRARVLFELSADAYQEGRFEAAAGMLEEAYRLDPAPILLYNLARARESNGEDERAADAYRTYLELEPEADNRAQIEARIRALAPPPQEVVVQSEPVVEAPLPEEDSGRPTWAPWLVAGLGAGVAGAGVIVGVMANSRASDAEGAVNHEAGSLLAVEADGLATTSTVLLVAGGAVALAGVIWGVIWAATGEVDDHAEAQDRKSVV